VLQLFGGGFCRKKVTLRENWKQHALEHNNNNNGWGGKLIMALN
jgi:hypothetical protein